MAIEVSGDSPQVVALRLVELIALAKKYLSAI
jgi:hypothetical protein